MKMTGDTNMTKQANKMIKILGSLVLTVSMVGCSGTAYVETADRMDVITLGDSIFDLNGQIQANLELMAGETFRNYTQSGAELSGGVIASAVDSQYASAKVKDSNISTIVMNGAGNDILIPAMLFDPYGCRTQWYRWSISKKCKNLVIEQYVTAVNLLNEMDADGVSNIVYLGYYVTPRSNANLAQAIEMGDDYLSYACNTASTANCTFIDPRGTVSASNVEADDIHPTPNGSLILANQIWPILKGVL
mgnify:CR=1 FL=1